MLTTPIVYIVTPVVPIINLITKSPVTPSSEQTVGQANPGAVCAVCTLRLPGVVERIRKRFGVGGNYPLEQPPPPPLLNNLNKNDPEASTVALVDFGPHALQNLGNRHAHGSFSGVNMPWKNLADPEPVPL